MVIVLVMKVVNNNYSYTKFMKYKIIITIKIISNSKPSLLIIVKSIIETNRMNVKIKIIET